MKKHLPHLIVCLLLGASGQAEILYSDSFDDDGLAVNANGVGGGAGNHTIQGHSWADDGEASFVTNGITDSSRAILYSANTFQSDTGFRLTVNYTTASIENVGGHRLSFGLVSSETNLSTYVGYNPFQEATNVYSIGANVTAVGGAASRGLNFTNSSSVVSLDTSGTRQQFVAGESTEVTIEIGYGGYWCYRINGEYEASGALPTDFDLTKDYHIVVYGQDDKGGKSIQSITLEEGYDQGERAEGLRMSWSCGQGDSNFLQNLKTVTSTLARVNEGSTLSAEHNSPHRLLEMIASGDSIVGGSPIFSVVPETWGDFSHDEPDSDAFLDDIVAIRNAQLGSKFYSNCDNFTGSNQSQLQPFVDRWFDYCDTDPEVQAFINSQPYHTGIWNETTQQYEDASVQYPNRKYVFCYAEFVLKDISLRYGKYATSWTFDSGKHLGANGDNAESGLIEEQRIFQAFANAVWAGNPDCPVAFNNGRLDNDEFGVNPAYPYARSTRFDDFTFGHAHNGNNDHASLAVNPHRNETVFASNYRHVTRMTDTNGFVQVGGDWDWDDKVVGNYHSKLGVGQWRYGSFSAWEQADFNQWNLEAIQAGGHMTWEGAISKGANPYTADLHQWAQDFLTNTDDYLAANVSPDTPKWTRKYTDLPGAIAGEPYTHVLVEGEDFYVSNSDANNEIASIAAIKEGFFAQVPSWLTISEDPAQGGSWILSGTPTELAGATYEFSLEASDASGDSASRGVELQVAALSDGLIAEWRFEEGAGTTVADSISGAYEATRATGTWITGACGSAMSFDGTQEGLNLPGGAFSEVSATNEITISMWVNGSANQPVSDTVLNAVDTSGNRILNIHLPWSNGDIFWDAGDASGYDRVREGSTPSEYSGSWSFWVFTKNANTGEMSIYLNGALKATETGQTSEIGEIASVVLGDNVNGGNGYEGAIDEVRIYSQALDSAQVLSRYHDYLDKGGYDAWFDSFPNTSGSGGLIGGKEEDFDGDGILNLMEYVLNSDPTIAGLDLLPVLKLNGGEIVFRFTRRAESAEDTSQYFQYSINLIDWNDLNITGEQAPEISIADEVNGTEDVTVTLGEALAPDGRLFGRLRVMAE
ncbi:hypothetical protein N9956_02345 [Akkermansiaceae bacterium]|nr:hypothetical protein [Akkermansiaceae bacterium]